MAQSLQAIQLKPDRRRKASFTVLLDKLPHFRVVVGNEFPQLSYVLDFEGNETEGRHLLHFLRHMYYDFFRRKVSTMEFLRIKVYCIITKEINVGYTACHVCCG